MLDLNAVGHKVIIEPEKVEKKSKGGILLAYQDEKLAQHSVQKGVVRSIGNNAYKAFRVLDNNGKEVNGRPWCSVGDKVVYSRYVGQYYEPEVKDTPEELYVILNDDDIHAVFAAEDSTDTK